MSHNLNFFEFKEQILIMKLSVKKLLWKLADCFNLNLFKKTASLNYSESRDMKQETFPLKCSYVLSSTIKTSG